MSASAHDPPQQLLQALYNAVKEDDSCLAELIVGQKGVETYCDHLDHNKDGLRDRDTVMVWIKAARLIANLVGTPHDGIALLHRIYEAMLELADSRATLPVGSGDVLWNLGSLYFVAGYQRTSERHFTLALCSDIVGGNSLKHIKTLGAYPTLRTHHRHSERKLDEWVASTIHKHEQMVAAQSLDA